MGDYQTSYGLRIKDVVIQRENPEESSINTESIK